MIAVIFRARIRSLDAEYMAVAQRMRELAISHYGCIAFHAVTEGRDEIALSYWPSEEAIRAWKADPEHLLAQETGRSRWYESYSVQVAAVQREYNVSN